MSHSVDEVFYEYLLDASAIDWEESNKGIDWDLERMKHASEIKEKKRCKIAFCEAQKRREVCKVKSTVRTVKKLKNPSRTANLNWGK